MTLDEAIAHCEEVAEEKQKQADGNIQFVKDNIQYLYDGKEYRECCECAKEHRQLAEWLKELKRHREAWQKVKEDISHRENRLPCSTVGDVAMKSAYVIALEVIDEALKEIEKGEE